MVQHHLTWRCRSHVSPTCYTDAGSGLPLLNSLTFRPVVGQLSEVVPFLLLEQRCGIAYQAMLSRPRRCGVQEQAEDILVPPLLRNCLTLNYISFSQSLSPLHNSGPCNSFHCLGHLKNVYDDDDDPELIMGNRVKCLLEVHKVHTEWLLVLTCLVHQYSEIHDLISCPPSLSESRLFVCNFRFRSSLGYFQYDPKKDLACMGDKSNCCVICTLFKIAFLLQLTPLISRTVYRYF